MNNFHILLIGNISNAQFYRPSRHWYCNFPIVKQQIETNILKFCFRQLIFTWHWALFSALLWVLGFCEHFRFVFSLVLRLQLALCSFLLYAKHYAVKLEKASTQVSNNTDKVQSPDSCNFLNLIFKSVF